MEKYERIIFVSTDDTCKGPMAEGVMKQLIGGRDLEAVSRGLVVLFPEPINPKAIAAAESYGIPLNHPRAKALSSEDFGERNLVLTMTAQQKASIYERFDNALNVYSIHEFLDGDGDIEDPAGGDMTEYVECFDRISVLVNLVAEKIFSEEEKDDSNRL